MDYQEGELLVKFDSAVSKQELRQILKDLDAFLIKNAETGELMGAANLRDIDTVHNLAEVSFWLSPPFWGGGHATASLERLLEVGFVNHGLNRLYGYHMVRNTASGKVMQKVGFTREGTLRQRVYKAGKYEDVQIWSILKEDWKSASNAPEKITATK